MTDEEFQGYVKAKLDLIPQLVDRFEKCQTEHFERTRQLELQVASIKGASGIMGFLAGILATVLGWLIRREG